MFQHWYLIRPDVSGAAFALKYALTMFLNSAMARQRLSTLMHAWNAEHVLTTVLQMPWKLARGWAELLILSRYG